MFIKLREKTFIEKNVWIYIEYGWKNTEDSQQYHCCLTCFKGFSSSFCFDNFSLSEDLVFSLSWKIQSACFNNICKDSILEDKNINSFSNFELVPSLRIAYIDYLRLDIKSEHWKNELLPFQNHHIIYINRLEEYSKIESLSFSIYSVITLIFRILFIKQLCLHIILGLKCVLYCTGRHW